MKPLSPSLLSASGRFGFLALLLLTLHGTLLTLTVAAQAPAQRAAANPWTDAPAARAAVATSVWKGRLTAFRPVTAPVAALAATLAQTPLEGRGAVPLVLALPTPDGGQARFAVMESPVMEPGLAARFPRIKTYVGQGLDDPTATLRADLTPQGFHAQVMSREAGHSFYLDPVRAGQPAAGLLSYWRQDLTRPASGTVPACGVTEAEMAANSARLAPLLAAGAGNGGPANRVAAAWGTQLRTYRLAVAATGEYTAFHGGTVALTLAAIVTTVNRVVGVYETDLAVRMVLVANNASIIYTNAATDPYSNSSGDLSANQTTINAVIGAANYDIGHLMGTGGGGIAGLGVVCGANKARGLTGSPAPVGDAFDIDYVAHEIGHQFSGNHSFNGNVGSCSGGNRAASRAWEPGSGTTIMAYAGICGSQNLQPNSDAYFHGGNLVEMRAFITAGGGACGTVTATGNTAPTFTTTVGPKSIPASTPFKLTADATDAEGNPLTYCWEEFDLGPAGAPVTSATIQTVNATVPLFRTFLPVSSGTRYFPRLNELRNNTTVFGEALPTVDRTMAFRCTARDNQAGGGGVEQTGTVTLTVVNTGAAFAVTAPNTAVSYPGGSTQTVTWTVAGTTAAPISCATVNIRLSTDGGQTFPTVLATAEPNNGSAAVTIPNTSATTCRVMVEANDNYFFDISNTDFAITAVPVPTLVSLSPASGPAGTSVTLTGTNFTGPTGISFNGTAATTFSVTNAATATATVPAGATTGNVTITIPGGTSNGVAFTVCAPPVALAQAATVQLDASGTATITAAAVNNGSTANCGFAAGGGLSVSPGSFSCANLGANTVTLTVTDVFGNVATATATVTVEDKVAPTAQCQQIEVYLGQNGSVSVTPAQVNNGSTDNCTAANDLGLALNPSSFTAASATPYPVTLTVTDASGNAGNCSSTMLVKKRPTTLVYSGSLSGQYSDHITLTAQLRDQLTATGLPGKQITFTIGSQTATATTDANGDATTTLLLTQAPGPYTLTSNFTGDATYVASADSDPFGLQREDARVTYTGALFSSTASATASLATVTLSATVQDISAVSPADAKPGDIRNATVTFINRDNNTVIAANVPVGLVSLSDLRTGTATTSWRVDIGSNSSLTFSVGIVVNGYYTRDNSDDNTLITVAKPLNDFVTGGGFVLLTASAGQKAGDVGSKNNFGFSIKYSKSSKNLQGHINTIVRRTEPDGLHVYQVKGNVMSSLSVQPATATAPARATFNGKANIQDITNRLAPVSVDGNATLQVTMTDGGEPGTQDLIGITVWNKDGGLWVASNWNGTRTTEKLLGGGNLVVRGGAYSLRSSTGSPAGTAPLLATGEAALGRPTLEVYPNPMRERATIRFRVANTGNAQLRVYNALGQVVATLFDQEAQAGQAYETGLVGTGLADGLYFCRLQLGDQQYIQRVVLSR